jgi:hypothetical protein
VLLVLLLLDLVLMLMSLWVCHVLRGMMILRVYHGLDARYSLLLRGIAAWVCREVTLGYTRQHVRRA